jgi:AcrR family transcriptional regulator
MTYAGDRPQRDIFAVSIRDIAQAAGVSHGLVRHHFGTREELVAVVVRSEIDGFAAAPQALPARATSADLEPLREELRAGMTRFPDYALVITRAELAGAEPERLLDPAVPTPAMLPAASIRDLQAGTAPAPGGWTPAW